MNLVRTAAVAAGALAALVLTACGSLGSLPAGPPEAKSYGSLEEVRAAVIDAGFPCERFEVREHPFMNLGPGEDTPPDIRCNDGNFLQMTYYPDPALLQQFTKSTASGPGWDADYLIGPNWQVDFSSPDELQRRGTSIPADAGGAPALPSASGV
jgi:hypothetical protein